MNPEFPLYIVSKGRHTSRLTVRVLEKTGIPYRVVVEEQEYPLYAEVIDPDHLLILPPEYKENYELLDDLGLSKSTGPGPARNFAWDHSVSEGHDWHWVMDDNIKAFFRRNGSLRDYLSDGTCFRACEDWVQRYENIAMAGPDYYMFSPAGNARKVFLMNTRIYSCNLIRNDIPFRWRGRYNEDTILSLDVLKAGWCTVLWKWFLACKITTQLIKGGCTREFYEKEGTLNKSRMLVREHPDCARLTFRYGRWHHYVNTRKFQHRNRLRRKAAVEVSAGVDDYGMRMRERDGTRS